MKTKPLFPLLLDQQLCFTLYSASRLMVQAYAPFLKELDLTYPQYLVMLVLWEKDHVSVSEIGERLLLDSGTLSPLLKKLQEKGVLSRVRSPEDERQVTIALTEQGKSLKKAATKIPNAMFCQLEMKEQELVDLREQLKGLINHLND